MSFFCFLVKCSPQKISVFFCFVQISQPQKKKSQPKKKSNQHQPTNPTNQRGGKPPFSQPTTTTIRLHPTIDPLISEPGGQVRQVIQAVS